MTPALIELRLYTGRGEVTTLALGRVEDLVLYGIVALVLGAILYEARLLLKAVRR